MLITDREYPYVYETHMHTKQGSACGKEPGSVMARAYKEAGYTGIIITDHFFYGNTAPDRSLPWRDWVNEFCSGYEDAKKEGDRIGLQVFFGWEACYHGTEFLIYGLDKEWLLNHEEIRDASIEEQLKLVHDGGGMVIQAHPYREEAYIPEVRVFPELVDGLEGTNAAHYAPRHEGRGAIFDVRAHALAKEYGLPMTAGSDQHSTELNYGGMRFKRKLDSVRDYIKAVIGREDCKLIDFQEFDR